MSGEGNGENPEILDEDVEENSEEEREEGSTNEIDNEQEEQENEETAGDGEESDGLNESGTPEEPATQRDETVWNDNDGEYKEDGTGEEWKNEDLESEFGEEASQGENKGENSGYSTRHSKEIWDIDLPEDAEEEGYDDNTRPSTTQEEAKAPNSARSVDSYGSAGSGTYVSPVQSPKHKSEGMQFTKDSLIHLLKESEVSRYLHDLLD